MLSGIVQSLTSKAPNLFMNAVTASVSMLCRRKYVFGALAQDRGRATLAVTLAILVLATAAPPASLRAQGTTDVCDSDLEELARVIE